MTPQEAIKRLTNIANEKWAKDELKDADACQLGIEALKAWERIRIGATSQHLWKLPGETEE